MAESLIEIKTQYLGSVNTEKTLFGTQEDTEVYEVPAQGYEGGETIRIFRKDQEVKELIIWGEEKYVQHLDIHYWTSKLQGIKVKFFDGTELQVGSTDDMPNRKKWQLILAEKELITKTAITRNDNDKRAQALELTTTKQKFTAGVERCSNPDETVGYLAGVYGRAGTEIDKLGIILHRPKIIEYQLYDVQYNLSAIKNLGDTLLNIKEEKIINSSSATMTNRVSFSVTHTETKSWSNKAGGKIGVKTQVKAGFPFLAEGKVEVSAEVSYDYTWGGQVTEAKTDTWESSVSVPPHTVVKVTATVTESKIDVPYVAMFLVTYEDGAKALKKVEGSFVGVNLSSFIVKATDIEQIPQELGSNYVEK
ncbi:ETX/MTX2 family pore-forming toxin [Laspinema olomoucense]|uniref:ETX/MTX2 family pore-forming toxin n=1 Tax=Laspinema olomoucense TaxID=3231600 RepID=UPI0021BB0EEE|nr:MULTISPECIES: ETX/MTX2 family pore-forming toxin [unclassified Laspinema]MCT7975719.1 ETX/MTX2 family pore-forming toxin [Laspinema sp. D3d]MCT7997451.1 ETX/MTX2 family pore-forming toxin [Laspinema sp. D3c]